jgi:hypothetical protein
MKKNVGSVDTIIRIVLAAAIAGLYFGGFVHGKIAMVLAALAAILLITGVVGFCPLYVPLGISTRKKV